MPLTDDHDRIFEVPEIEYPEVIKQIPEVEVQFVEKHVKLHRVRQHPEQEESTPEGPRSGWDERTARVCRRKTQAPL